MSRVETTWRRARLVDVTTYLSRGITPRYVENKGLRVLNQRCVRDGEVSFGESRLTSGEQNIPKEKILLPYDILVNSTGTGTLGRVAQVINIHEPTTVDSHVTIIRPDTNEVNPLYLGYVCKKLQKKFESMGEGSSGQTELSRTRLKEEIEILLPNILEQKRIADMLSVFDEKIENNNRIIKTLEEMVQVIFREWFIKEQKKDWKTTKVGDLVQRLPQSKTYRSEELKKDGAVPVYDQSSGVILGYHDGEPSLYASIDEPIVLFGDHTCRMRLVVDSCSLGPNVVPFIGNNYPTLFVYYLTEGSIRQREYKRHWTEFEKKEFVVPPTGLSDKFVSLIKPMIQNMSKIESENQRLAAMRDLLLPKLMSGEIRV